SLAMAFAPFSQNSNVWRLPSGDGHAQLWQSNPFFWLTVVNTRSVLRSPSRGRATRNVLAIAGSPAAECEGARIAAQSRSMGGCASRAAGWSLAGAEHARPT